MLSSNSGKTIYLFCMEIYVGSIDLEKYMRYKEL